MNNKIKICFNCQKTISRSNVGHARTCRGNISKEEFRFKQICFETKINFTKELMIELYVEQENSLPDFKKKFNMNYEQTLFLLVYFNISKRGYQESAKTKKVRNKYKETCIEKFGCDNVSKNKNIKEKKAQTFLEHYGVDNIWKTKEYSIWLYNHMVAKYGKGSLSTGNADWHKNLTPEQKNEFYQKMIDGTKKFWHSRTENEKDLIIQKRLNTILNKNLQPVFISKLEKRVEEVLIKNKISFKAQFFITRKSYDFRINNTNILIEIQGDYWHANPNIYESNDLITYPDNKILKASDVWENNRKKQELANKYKYEVLEIWEKDITKLNDIELEHYVLERLNFYENFKNKVN